MYQLCAAFITMSLFSVSLLANTENTEPSYADIGQDEIASCSQDCFFPTSSYVCLPLSCRSCCQHYYFGLEGGWAGGLGYADRINGGLGGNVNGFAYNGYAHSGYHVGANLGYRWSSMLRTDLSYTYLSPSSYKWRVDGGPPFVQFDIRFKGHLHTHLVLLNTYLHLNALYCFLPCLDPYITGGVGVAINRLDDIKETLNDVFVANIHSLTNTNFGARVGIGAMKYFCRSWILDFGFNANYIGRVGTDNKRTSPEGVEGNIGPYHFENNWIGTFYLGVKYAF